MTPTLRRLIPSAALALLLALPAGAQTAPAAPAAPTDTPAAEAAPAAVETLPDVVLGSPDAPLTIVEYASFTCSHCRDFHDENFPKVKAEYIDTGKVRFIQRDVYFDEIGLWAGVLARCGGDTKFYAMSDLLFGKQKEWLTAKTPQDLTANLRRLGVSAGMTAEQVDACWADEKQVERLVATFQKNAVADRIEGTPTFIIGGESVPNQEWSKLKAKIDAKLAEVGSAAAAPAAATGAPAAPAPAAAAPAVPAKN